jgi:hypothetical protein
MDPYIKEKIEEYFKIYPKIKNYYLDVKFDILGLDTLQKSPINHYTLEVKTNFENNIITIFYSKKDCILALEIMNLRISDPFFIAKTIKIGEKEYKIKNNLIVINEEEITNMINILDKLIEECYKTDRIYIIPSSNEDYIYAKNVLIYITNSLHHNDYFLLKELDR